VADVDTIRRYTDSLDQKPVTDGRPRVDKPPVKALVRAFRWKEMLESGRYTTIIELAKAANMNASYVAHVLRLTLLAPDTVEVIPGRTCSSIGSVNTLTGFEVGCSRVSNSDDGMFHTVVGQLPQPQAASHGQPAKESRHDCLDGPGRPRSQ
jgi:hypothetical protein